MEMEILSSYFRWLSCGGKGFAAARLFGRWKSSLKVKRFFQGKSQAPRKRVNRSPNSWTYGTTILAFWVSNIAVLT
tara:strand:- start:164 stop:391 length:228 start_codon:yes stop_codon:yes gene_type:complete